MNFAIEHPDRVDSLVILNSAYAEAPTGRWPELIELFATKNLKALALAILQSPEHFGWLLNWQREKFQESLIDSQKRHYSEFLGVRLGDLAGSNCRKALHVGQAFKAISTVRSSSLRVAPVDA